MKIVIAFLIILFFLLQYQLWFSPTGFLSAIKLKKEIALRLQNNILLQKRNQQIAAEIHSLKKDTRLIEEKARTELGMIKNGEVYYQIVPSPVTHQNP